MLSCFGRCCTDHVAVDPVIIVDVVTHAAVMIFERIAHRVNANRIVTVSVLN